MVLVLAACGSTVPASEAGSQPKPKAESEKPEAVLASPSDKLSADNPVVVLPKNEDLERRKELAALLPTAAETDAISKGDSSTSVTQAEKPAVDDSQDTTEPVIQKDGTAVDPESQQPAGSDPAAEPPAPTPERVAGGKVGNDGAELRGIVAWVNSEPLSLANLRGKVVLVDFGPIPASTVSARCPF
jgi:hypothetical protein